MFHVTSIRDLLADSQDCESRFLWDATKAVSLKDALHGTSLCGRISEAAGRSVLLALHDQLAAALALIELDGVARRLVICPPDVSPHHIAALINQADVEVVVFDNDPPYLDTRCTPLHAAFGSGFPHRRPVDVDPIATEWVLLTSGTSGRPKMVAHTMATLTAPIQRGQHNSSDVVWGTFYDIRRYGGLQIFLRALLGRCSLVLSSAGEAPTDHLQRLAAHSVTHLTGTPSHWRRALMSADAGAIAPKYIRLSGEIVDQSILNALGALYPKAAIGHAFASTEAGVVFEVNDGLEGFPASFVGHNNEVDMKVEDNSLRIRSPRTATHLVGQDISMLKDSEGFVDTGDIVQRRCDRYHFQGRRGGVINVGGLKVHPEEIETLLNRHPAVQMSAVRAQGNPIMGSLLVADVVLKNSAEFRTNTAGLKQDILKICRETLPRHKVPVVLNFVPALNLSAAGKMGRRNA